MAELLIKNTSNSHPDPQKDASGSYKQGDVVEVHPDGYNWGRGGWYPAFVIVKIPGIDPLDMEHLELHAETQMSSLVSLAVRAIPRMFKLVARATNQPRLKRRRYSLDITGLVPDADGFVTVAATPLTTDKTRI